jgi:AraC-like DNA-binding protein
MTLADQPRISKVAIPRVEIGWLHPFLEILVEAGAPWEQMLERAGLPVLASDNTSALVPTARVYDFTAIAHRESGLADLGLRAGARLNVTSMLPDAERAWIRAGTYRSIHGFISGALASSSDVELWIERRATPAATTEFFYSGTFGPDHPAFETVEQFMVAVMLKWVRYGAGQDWNPARINFRSKSVPEDSIRRVAGPARIALAQDTTSLVFPARLFVGPMEPFPQEDSPIWRQHRDSLERGEDVTDFVASLRIVLPAYLPDGSPVIERAARLAGTSVRTLQRRLEDQGTTYSQLLDDLRHDLALYLLRDSGRTLSEISHEIGYRDPAVLTRAFRRWTGLTPRDYRRMLAPS